MASRISHFTGTTGGTFHHAVPVKKFRGGRMIGGADVIIDALPGQMAEAVKAHGEDVLELAQDNILTHAKRAGVALGSGADEQDLAASGYVSTGGTAAYEKAKSAMIDVGSRDARRGLFADAVTFDQPTDGFRAVVSFASGRAKLMHEGYGNLAGTPFLDDAFDSLEKLMTGRLIGIVDTISRIDVPDFMDVDHNAANQMNQAKERSYRFIMLGPGANLMGHRSGSRDAKMRRASNRAAARDTDAAQQLRSLRQTIQRVNRERR